VRLVEIGPGSFRLRGTVDFDSALAIRAEVDAVVAARADVVLSLADVTEGNSLLVALMIGWFRHARRLNHAIRYTDVPALLHALIEFSGLEAVLPLEGAACPGVAESQVT
jgi:ABC-type transporter Mla MlaB component